MKPITLANRSRLQRLLPNNYPRYVRVYDDEKSGDRYTVVFTGRYNQVGRRRGERAKTEYWHINMSEHPFHPQGVCQMGFSDDIIDVDAKEHRFTPAYGKVGHLGKRIHWHELPEDCQKAALHAYKELWDLYPATADKNGRIQVPNGGIQSERPTTNRPGRSAVG